MKTILYVVRNKEGKYLRAKGRRSWVNSWADNIEDARIYAKIGLARSQVTFWAAKYPGYGTPDLVALEIINTVVVDETKRLEKSVANSRKRKEAIEKFWQAHRSSQVAAWST